MGSRENLQEAYTTLQAAVARLGSMPLPRLGAELMPRFQPVSSEILPSRQSIPELAEHFAPGFVLIPTHPAHKQLQAHLRQLILEGLQVLEHASLICIHFEQRGIGHLNYQATRRGLAVLSQGTVEQTLWASHQPEV